MSLFILQTIQKFKKTAKMSRKKEKKQKKKRSNIHFFYLTSLLKSIYLKTKGTESVRLVI